MADAKDFEGDSHDPRDRAALELARQAVGVDRERLAGLLEQAQAGLDCAACLYPTCRAYAGAMASGKERRPHLCEPGGDASARATQIILDSWRQGRVVITPEAERARYQPP